MGAFIKIFLLSAYVTLVLGLPNISDLELWWGPKGGEAEQNKDIRPFNLTLNEDMIYDLRERINRRRNVTPPLEGVAFQYGFNTDNLDGWMNYWANDYNFKEREFFFNQFPHYKTNIQGLDIHFIRVTPEVSDGVESVPLLLLHGWPGSVREFYESIPLFTAPSEDRNFVVEVIVPSLPGFGFSDGATGPGLGEAEMAVICKNLMERLGFTKFYVQGGDFGAIVATNMVTLFPENILGYHTNFPVSYAPSSIATWFFGAINPSLQALVVDSDLAARLYPISLYLLGYMEEFGYLHIQATKPDTIGVAMADSPAGLLAYLLQAVSGGCRKINKFKNDGGLDDIFTRDQLIDLVMFYWMENKFTTSVRVYAESFNLRTFGMGISAIPTAVPTWTIHAKDEIIYQTPAILKYKFTNLLNSTILDDYGHFLAFEKPDVLVEDVLKAITAFRAFNAQNTKDEL